MMNEQPKGTLRFKLADRAAKLRELRGLIGRGLRNGDAHNLSIIAELEGEIVELQAALTPPLSPASESTEAPKKRARRV